ncbi:MAG: FtsX-like permease family protein [Clostridiales bacterium]|nr:FtsX-like permease family protein [Candidatus Crickella caballi]
MKKTQRIELIKNIRDTKVSFISILMFVALGIAVFAGLTWTMGSVQKAVDQELNDASFHDIEVVFPYGFTDKDLDKMRALDGFDEIEGTRTAFAFLKLNDGSSQMRLMQLTKKLDTPLMVEGELPTKKGEIAVETRFADDNGIKIGDTISFAHDDDNGLALDKFKVTALMETPEYISRASGTYGAGSNMIAISGLMFITKDSFAENRQEFYTGAIIRSNELRGLNTFSEKYKEGAESLRNRSSQVISEIAGDRYDEVKSMQEDAIDDIESQLAAALERINSGTASIEASKTQLKRSSSKLNKMEGKLDEASDQIKEAEGEVSDYEKARNTALSMCDELEKLEGEDPAAAEAYVNENSSDIQAALTDTAIFASIFVSDDKTNKKLTALGTAALGAVEEDPPNVAVVVKSTREIYRILDITEADVKAEIADKKKELAKKRGELKKYRKQYAEAQKKVKQAEAQLVNARNQYNEKRAEADEYIAALPDLVKYDCNILTREQNAGFVATRIATDAMGKLRYTMAALFVIVGLLVCYSAVSRIVHDQTIKIGTKKALGLMNREITTSYLAYSGIAVALGSVLGLLLGGTVIEKKLVGTMANTYVMTETPAYWDVGLAAVLTLTELILIVACTWLACRSILKESAVKLLAGPTKSGTGKKFFEDWEAWKRLPLFSKTVVRNFISDKRRVFATLVGVAGCTALVVCAVMMDDNIGKSLDKQFGKIFNFDNIVYYLDDENDGTEQEIKSRLEDEGLKSSAVLSSAGSVNTPDGQQMFMNYFVPTEENFGDFVTILPIDATDADTQSGVWMNVSFAKEYGVQAGDEIVVVDATGQERSLEVSGFFEYYLTRLQLIISPDAYEAAWGEKPQANSLFIFTGDENTSMDNELGDVDGYVATGNYLADSREFFNSFTSVSKALVATYLILAIVMALLVLLNLYTMFVDEKKKEIIVMMINGFSTKSARQYIYRDTILMTVIGILLGLVLGTVMGAASIHSFESSVSYFIKAADWKACIIGAAVSSALSLAMMQIALRRIDKFKLSDINK